MLFDFYTLFANGRTPSLLAPLFAAKPKYKQKIRTAFIMALGF